MVTKRRPAGHRANARKRHCRDGDVCGRFRSKLLSVHSARLNGGAFRTTFGTNVPVLILERRFSSKTSCKCRGGTGCENCVGHGGGESARWPSMSLKLAAAGDQCSAIGAARLPGIVGQSSARRSKRKRDVTRSSTLSKWRRGLIISVKSLSKSRSIICFSTSSVFALATFRMSSPNK
jgi:hypothetical protein